jgi:ABC-2 type transport system permease protein
VRSNDELETAFRRGLADVALVIPPRFQERVRSGRGSSVQLVINGTDPQIVGGALSAAQGLASSVSHRIEGVRMNSRGLRPLPQSVVVEPLIKYNPDRRTAVFIVPGLVGVILTMTLSMFTAMAIARERERGTLEALIVSPARPYEIVLGKILPYILVGYLQMAVILGLGHLVFDVPVRGSLPLLFLLSGAFILANLTVGLLFSTLAKTQQQAMQMSFFFLLPNILLSGFMFPFAAMPGPAQWVAQCLPLTHFMRIVRRVVLQGAGYPDVALEFLWLTGIFVALLLLTSLRFKKKLL